MKNITYLIIMTALIFTACSKDSLPKRYQSGIGTYTMEIMPSDNNYYKQENTAQKVTYKIIDGRIVLDNAEDFKVFMWALESRNLSDWENELPFHSYRTTNASTLVGNSLSECPALSAAINASGIIQIDPYFFKFNPTAEKIYVTESNTSMSIEEFSQIQQANSVVKEFSYEDDIWYLLENNMLPNEDLAEEDGSGKKCNEQKARNKKETQAAQSCSGTTGWWNQARFQLKYNRFGIWETCKAAFQNDYYNVFGQTNGQLEDFYVFGGVIDYEFDERCGPVYQGYHTIPAITTSSLQMTLRSNTKPLARYKSSVTMQVAFKYLCAPNDPLQQHTISISNF